jgi:hypothetical protein
MTQIYFHCSNPREVLLDRRGTAVDDLAEARDQAACVVHSLTMTHSVEDWRSWILHVSDDLATNCSSCRSRSCLANALRSHHLRLLVSATAAACPLEQDQDEVTQPYFCWRSYLRVMIMAPIACYGRKTCSWLEHGMPLAPDEPPPYKSSMTTIRCVRGSPAAPVGRAECADQQLHAGVFAERSSGRARMHRSQHPSAGNERIGFPGAARLMALVTMGKLNKQVAGELRLSEVTVKIHRGAAMRKMGARSLADLVRMTDALKETKAR